MQLTNLKIRPIYHTSYTTVHYNKKSLLILVQKLGQESYTEIINADTVDEDYALVIGLLDDEIIVNNI